MASYIETVEDTCDKLHKALRRANEKLDNSGEINERDAEYIRNLMSGIKSAKTIKAMEEHKDDYSNDYDPRTGMYVMERGRSYRGNGSSYGRGRNANRDSMGRYTSTGYSRDEAMQDMADDIRNSMPSMPEHLRREAEKFLNKLEQEM